MSYSQFLKESLQKSSILAINGFGKVTGSTKKGDNNQVLTETDLNIGQFLIGEVQSQYPQHNIIDEEAGVIDHNSIFTWVIDPIDGTSNFALGIPLYGVMIGLLENGIPVAGGIALPAFQQIYLAEKGVGAYCNDERISVSPETRLLSSLVAYGIDGHQEDPQRTINECTLLTQIVLNIRNLRTSNSAFDIAMLAEGRYGAVLNNTSRIWDCVAPQIIIGEAGGLFTDFYGEPMNYTNPIQKVNQNFTSCASTTNLHPQLQKIIYTWSKAIQ